MGCVVGATILPYVTGYVGFGPCNLRKDASHFKTYKSGFGAFRQNSAFCVNARHARLRLTLLTAARASAALFMFDFHILESVTAKELFNT